MSKESAAMTRIVRRFGMICATALLCALTGATAADARVATCDDIAAAQSRGLTTEAIRQELTTTTARIEGCARLAKHEAQHEARRSHARARRSARVGLAR